MSKKYQIASDYIFINALSKVSGIKLPEDLEKAYELLFDDLKRYKVPDYYNLVTIKTRYPCVANFTSPTFQKSELYDIMQSQPDNYFLLIDAFNSGADSLFFAFNNDYHSIVKQSLKNQSSLIITRNINGTTKQLISAETLLN